MMLRRCFVAAMLLGALCFESSADAGEPKQKRLTVAQLAQKIDHFIDQKLKQEKVKPTPVAGDSEFVRRVYLDIVGRVPRVSEVRLFLLDKAADKRQKLIERLLTHPLYVRHQTATWRQIILPDTDNQQARFAIPSFQSWLTGEIRKNTKYNELVRKILSPPPQQNNPYNRGFISPYGGASPQVVYYQANEYKPENLAASVTRTFLGIRLECAQCHNHPFAKYTREQFWSMAAFFTNVRQGVRVRPNGAINSANKPPQKTSLAPKIKIPETTKFASAKFLQGRQPNWSSSGPAISVLAKWITSPDNPYFARTGANRVWDHFFGVGLIDPVDDEPTDDNPISHPELLKLLTEQFVAHQFDLKYLMRAISLSNAYQRTSRVTDKNQMESRLFARMPTKAMSPAQVFDSIATATGYRETTGPSTNRFVVLGLDNTARGKFLAKFTSTESRTERQSSILQALTMMNGKFVADATSLTRSQTLAAIVDSPFMSLSDKVDTLFLATLSRFPSQEESARFMAYVNGGGATDNANRALADVFWVLLNSSEFILNH